ncbi:MAG: DUF4340 domain-containing protein [Proteobacteria bacterium]|nr:DUF4340 domain-containing protein [Pseudomonadota bacterium]
MLTKRSVLILAVITFVTAAAAVFAQYTRWTDTIRSVTSEPAFPKIGDALESVTRIKLIRADDNAQGSFTFSRAGERWVIDDKGGFPATQSVIRQMLLGFTELKLVEAKTRLPARFEKLNLADTSQAGSNASRVILEDKAGTVLFDALFGKRVASLSGSTPSIYMRRSGENQTWLATGELEIRGAALEWLSPQLLSILRERIERTTIMAPGEPPMDLIYDTKHKRFAIVDLPADRVVSSNYQLLQVGILPERLIMQDVRPSEGLAPDPALGGVVWRTKDGLTVTFEMATDPKSGDAGRPWAIVTVDVAADAKDKVVKEAKAIVARTKGWAYWFGAPMLKRLRATRDILTSPKS